MSVPETSEKVKVEWTNDDLRRIYTLDTDACTEAQYCKGYIEYLLKLIKFTEPELSDLARMMRQAQLVKPLPLNLGIPEDWDRIQFDMTCKQCEYIIEEMKALKEEIIAFDKEERYHPTAKKAMNVANESILARHRPIPEHLPIIESAASTSSDTSR